ncbi:hypothetical protein [Embleya sp. AB8]|uniref:hypothetical protein n=1 Tax=Embleya sp. AB8 TaxID=3156304 RepID=UPI003C784198
MQRSARDIACTLGRLTKPDASTAGTLSPEVAAALAEAASFLDRLDHTTTAVFGWLVREGTEYRDVNAAVHHALKEVPDARALAIVATHLHGDFAGPIIEHLRHLDPARFDPDATDREDTSEEEDAHAMVAALGAAGIPASAIPTGSHCYAAEVVLPGGDVLQLTTATGAWSGTVYRDGEITWQDEWTDTDTPEATVRCVLDKSFGLEGTRPVEATAREGEDGASTRVTPWEVKLLHDSLDLVDTWLRGESADGWRADLGDALVVAGLREQREGIVKDLAHWAAILSRGGADGSTAWGRGDFERGDHTRIDGRWYEVVRANPKTVTVASDRPGTTQRFPYGRLNARMTAEELRRYRPEDPRASRP